MTEPWSEDLAWLAERGAELGRKFCTCEGYYHCLWGLLRAGGGRKGLSSEEQLLSLVLTPFIRPGVRVLIGGSADTGVLCSFGRIYGSVKAEFCVVDKCRSPLELIGEFTASKGIACRTLHADILDLDDGETWDQVVLHYTANFVDMSERKRFFARVARVLAPGGTLVCSVMTGESLPPDQRDAVEGAFVVRGREFLREFLSERRMEIPDLDTMLRAYASDSAKRRLEMSTLPEVQEMLRDVGLREVSLNSTPRKFRYSEERGGKTHVDSSTLIVATRDPQ